MSYTATHNLIRETRGSARNYPCVECGEQAQEWALLHGSANKIRDARGRTYSKDLADYAAMCFRCHRLYDKAHITHCPQGHPYAGDNLLMDAGKRKCKTCVYERNRRRRAEKGLTPEQRARRTQLQRERRARRRQEEGGAAA